MNRLTAASVLLLLVAGCSPVKDMKLGEESVARFHRQLDTGQFQAIYDASGPELKKDSSAAKFVPLLAAIHAKLGQFKSGKIAGWNDKQGTSGHLLTLTYQSVYQNGAAQEEFVYRLKGDAATLLGYHISSDALIVG